MFNTFFRCTRNYNLRLFHYSLCKSNLRQKRTLSNVRILSSSDVSAPKSANNLRNFSSKDEGFIELDNDIDPLEEIDPESLLDWDMLNLVSPKNLLYSNSQDSLIGTLNEASTIKEVINWCIEL